MITFLPYTDMEKVAQCLDDKRLGAQRYEAWSILKWLRNPTVHPNALKAGYCAMWKGYEMALAKYVICMLLEWEKRGYKNDKMQPNSPELLFFTADDADADEDNNPPLPPWWGNQILHSYHRHALMAKLPEYYQKFDWTEDGSKYNGSYMWPVQRDTDSRWIIRWPKALKLPSILILDDKDKVGAVQDNDDLQKQKKPSSTAASQGRKTSQSKRKREKKMVQSTKEKVEHKRGGKRIKLRSGKQIQF